MIVRAKAFLDDSRMPTAEMLRSVLREHRAGCVRLEALREAYEGKGGILGRQRREGLPNNRIAHPYARYITTIATGYLIGTPVTYSVEGESSTLQAVQDIFKRGSESAENVQLARDQSVYGKGVEYVHIDQGGLPHTVAVSPERAFVVYDDSYDLKPLFGVYYAPRQRVDGSTDGWRVWVMNDQLVAVYEAASLDAVTSPASVEEHFLGGVPIIEYWNDEAEKGDFEWVLGLIDAYDKLQSDRVNDKEQFVDRLLVLTGAILEEDERGRKPMQQLREDHALQLPDSQSRAEYLTSEMNETDVEVLRRALCEDIHKLSMVPDLSDEHFAANASGVAMKYKLMGFEQIIRVKERWFTEGLRARLQLFINYLTLRGAEALDVADIKITFAHAMPANRAENAQVAKLAREAGAASVETAVRLLHAGDEWSEADIAREVGRIGEREGLIAGT